MSRRLPAFLDQRMTVAAHFAQETKSVLAAVDRDGNQLAFTMQAQQLGNWCWAATTASIRAFFREDSLTSQCDVASYHLGWNCCPPGLDRPDNRNNLDFALQTALGDNLAAPPPGRALTWIDVAAEIRDQRPICCAIRWSDGTAHFTVITGTIDGPAREIIMRDPKYPGEHRLPIERFTRAYRDDGQWVDSYRTDRAN